MSHLSGLSIDESEFDHVGIAVHSIEETASTFELVVGKSCSQVETLESQRVRVAFVGRIELIEPLGPDSTVARFLERRGPGLHHIAYHVDDLVGTLTRLSEEGFELIDKVPRSGARGHRVAFLHPKSTAGVLIELVSSG